MPHPRAMDLVVVNQVSRSHIGLFAVGTALGFGQLPAALLSHSPVSSRSSPWATRSPTTRPSP